MFRKLSFDLGEWSVGAAVTVYDGGDCYFPSIVRDSLQRLHLTFTWFDSATGNYRIRYKSSSTDGAVWGAGPSDAGSDLTNGSASAYSQLQYSAPTLYCVYTDASTKLAIRTLVDGGLLWGSEIVAHIGIFLSDRFSSAVSEGGSVLGIAFESTAKLYYVEFDGETWSGQYDLATGPVVPPFLHFSGADPYVIYGVSQGTEQVTLLYRRKQGSGFLPEAGLAGDVAPLLDVVLYDDGTSQYVSRKLEAASSSPADVTHFTSGALIAGAGDTVYFGALEKFACLTILLSTAGVGGAVAWEYFTGTNWQEFTPESGAYNFDQLSQLVRLWQDTGSTPAGWQACEVNSVNALWIRARVTTAFGTPPVGSQLTPLTNIKYLSR